MGVQKSAPGTQQQDFKTPFYYKCIGEMFLQLLTSYRRFIIAGKKSSL
jgi:hypothetical protein